MAGTIKITVVSGINADCYNVRSEEFGNRTFGCWDTEKLKSFIREHEGAKVEWIKGRNVFRGDTVDDKFFNSMVEAVMGP